MKIIIVKTSDTYVQTMAADAADIFPAGQAVHSVEAEIDA
jgi:hypothetical protein